ncbi:SpoIIE family protein phosphatase [Mycobacterium vicinigordonae]|uniref:SpoIIE family protein phosphatase n=1 Tax=Mycobacterium vicinigordonae TaxID=1719132 RepID=A0A7D6E2D9_9MYCO|nr:SpoIIE family protein phosphatase [Mycobacterium vicinigordonae]QLL07186.1 SpoIIE family protein phosphatase [Mycobacterium vicinigordonae]
MTSRSRPGEQACGDQGIAVEVNDRDSAGNPLAALFGVMDGLGHGPEAARAAVAAAETLDEARDERLEVLIQLCHRVLGGTRGAAMTLARIDFQTSKMSWTGIGNVSAHLVAKGVSGVQIRASARLVGGIVGYRIPETRPAQTVSIRTGDLLVIASDGIAKDHLEHLDFAASAKDIVEQVLTKHAKESDDAMVLAARHRGITT